MGTCELFREFKFVGEDSAGAAECADGERLGGGVVQQKAAEIDG